MHREIVCIEKKTVNLRYQIASSSFSFVDQNLLHEEIEKLQNILFQ